MTPEIHKLLIAKKKISHSYFFEFLIFLKKFIKNLYFVIIKCKHAYVEGNV